MSVTGGPHAVAVGALGALTPGLLSTAGVMLITVVTVNMLRRRLRDRASRERSVVDARRAGRADDARARLDARRSVDTSLADAEDLVRRFAAHLDTKAARLEKLIRDADDRLARLAAADAHPGAAPPCRPAPTPADRSADPISRNVYDLADQGLPPIEIAQRLSEGVGKVELILALRDP